MRHCHPHSHPPHLPPGLVVRREHAWPGASQNQHRPRRRWTPPDPGSLLAQIAAHTAEPLWKQPQNWTQAHVDFFCCRFEGADVPTAGDGGAEGPQDGDTRAQSSQAVSSSRPKSRRASSIMSLLSNKERSRTPTGETPAGAAGLDKPLTAVDEGPPPRWTASRPFSLVLGWSRPASSAACPALSRLLRVDDNQRARIKKTLDRGTGLEFHCKRQALFLLVDGMPCATLELNLCVPSQRRPPATSWRSSDGLIHTLFQRRRSSSSSSSSGDTPAKKGDKVGKKPAGGSRTTSGATTPTAPPTPPRTPPPPPPRVFPAAALVGEHSQAATLLRGLALGHVELRGVDQARAEQFPYQRFEARANRPVAATMHKCLRSVTPTVRLHDPYLLAIVIAMAQGQEAWRARLMAEDEDVLRRNGEEWLCEGGYKVHLVVTDHQDPSGVFVYGATVPPSLLAMLRHPRRAPSTASSSPASETSTESSPQRSISVKDEVVIRYQKVPYQPAEDFDTRVANAIEAGCERGAATG